VLALRRRGQNAKALREAPGPWLRLLALALAPLALLVQALAFAGNQVELRPWHSRRGQQQQQLGVWLVGIPALRKGANHGPQASQRGQVFSIFAHFGGGRSHKRQSTSVVCVACLQLQYQVPRVLTLIKQPQGARECLRRQRSQNALNRFPSDASRIHDLLPKEVQHNAGTGVRQSTLEHRCPQAE